MHVRPEFDLIAELASRLAPPPDGLGIGDDAATWPVTPGSVSVGTTDMLVEGVHFRLDWMTPRELGWKALAMNLSDLAAMGARPGRALVSVAVVPERRGILGEVYDGLAELASASDTYVVGGDTVRSSGPLVISVALVGEAEPSLLLRRDAARAGDVVAVTGRLGASAAGLALLVEGDRARLGGAAAAGLVAAHRRPVARLAAGRRLAGLGVRCAIDVSDGLASEARHLALASRQAIVIDVGALPLDPAAVLLLGEARARQLGLAGGEDYELLVTMPADLLAAAADALAEASLPLTRIGDVVGPVEGGQVRFMLDGTEIEPAAEGYLAF